MTPTTTPALEARDVARRFGRHWALAHLDLTVEPGESVLLAGPNGSGKTTFLRLAAGLYRATRGTLSVFGRDVRAERQTSRRFLSLVSHDAYLYPRLTALETVRVWARLLGRPARDADLMPLLEEVDLTAAGGQPVGGFSAGMRKRLTLLRSRLEGSRLVLLDEPFAALDVPGQKLVERWIAGFRRDGVAVVLASHSLEQAARLCDRAVVLHHGQKAWQGAAADVVSRFEEVTCRN
jgi:heme exporter protein A